MTKASTAGLAIAQPGIVTGYTKVELHNGSSKNYNFMRTYAEKERICYLVANHTMVVPAEEDVTLSKN